MNEVNTKYANVDEILSRVTTLCRGFDKTVNEIDIIEWCMLVENLYIPNVDNMYIYSAIPLRVINGKAKVPCNRWRIADVTEHDGHRVSFNDIGSYIVLHPKTHLKRVYIDYWGTPIDFETGKPLIQRGHEEACAWFCMYNLFLYEHGTGKITSDFWHQTIEANCNKHFDACRSSNDQFKTRDQMNQEQRITFDMLPVPARLWLLREEGLHYVEGEREEEEHRKRMTGEPVYVTSAGGGMVNVTGLRRQEFIATAGQTIFTVTSGSNHPYPLPDVYLVFIDEAPQRASLFTKSGNSITSVIPLTAGQTFTVYG